MTISNETNSRVTYAGTGSPASTYEVTFLDLATYSTSALVEENVQVYVQDADGAVTAITTNSGEATYWSADLSTNVSITFNVGIAATSTIIIDRNVKRTQETNYVENDAFPAQAHEDALDKLVRTDHNLQHQMDRTFRFNSGSTSTIAPVSVSASERANKVLAFDASGNFAVDQEIGTFQGNWAASTTYVQRDIVKDTSNANIYICNTAHTSSGSQPITSNTDSAKWDLLVDAASVATSASNAATSESNAATSASNAATSASNAATSESNAATSESNAATSASNASTSESSAATSASNAATSEANAGTSETNAATSASAASTSATAAQTAQTAAETAETNAATSETNAATSATNAATSESNAATSASNAATSASNAATSESNAATSATTASNAATSAATAYDDFDDRYLGSFASAPTVDNDGDPLITGALYFNTVSNDMSIYNGSNWQTLGITTNRATAMVLLYGGHV